MSRWRDVKHKNLSEKSKKKLNFTLSPTVIRIKAFITDTFMILMPLMYFTFYVIMGSREEFASNMLKGWICIFVPHFFIIIAFWYFKGQTPGYKAYDIKLVDKNLKKPSLLKLFTRYIIFTVLAMSIVGLLIRKDKKYLHDIISGTIPIQIED